MKKTISLILAVLMMALIGTALAEEATQTDLQPAPAPAAPRREQPQLLGGWTPAQDPTVTEDVKTLLDKATYQIPDLVLYPVAYLGSQVVAGTNHAILCQVRSDNPEDQPYFVIVYLYEDLQGNVSLINIGELDVGSLCTYGAE